MTKLNIFLAVAVLVFLILLIVFFMIKSRIWHRRLAKAERRKKIYQAFAQLIETSKRDQIIIGELNYQFFKNSKAWTGPRDVSKKDAKGLLKFMEGRLLSEINGKIEKIVKDFLEGLKDKDNV